MSNKKRKTSMPPDFYSSLKLGVLVGNKFAAKGSNFVFSPLSIRAALGLLAAAKMLTREHMLSLLSFLGSPNLHDLNASSASLVDVCQPSNNEDLMSMYFTNGIWVDHKLGMEPSKIAKSIFKASVERVNFIAEGPDVRRQINAWIEEGTAGLIKDFLPENFPDPSTIYVLANALYFKGIWEDKFDSSKTRDGDFYLLDGDTSVRVPFMTKSGKKMNYSFHEGFQVLMLPYKQDGMGGRHLSLIIFLPEKKDGLTDLIKKIASDPTFIDRHVPKDNIKVDFVKIPKFKISSKFVATKPLKKMGLDIPLLDTYHGAAIEVDEKGTIASATTVCGMKVSLIVRKKPIEFIADHPFIFAIRENKSGTIFFFGHVVNPKC